MDNRGVGQKDLYRHNTALRAEFPFVNALNSHACQASVERAYSSIARFYNNCRKSIPGKKGYPKFKRNCRSVEYSIDEVHLLEGDLISHGWGESKERLKIPINNEKNRQTYYGALNLFEPDLIVREYPAGHGENTVDFVKELIKINQEEAKKNNEEERQIWIIWDGATYHKGQEMRKLLGCINQDLNEEEWKVTCELFAPNAPEENPIEAIWLQLKNLLRRGYRFCKNFKIINRLFKLLVDLKLFNVPDIEKYDAFSCLI